MQILEKMKQLVLFIQRNLEEKVVHEILNDFVHPLYLLL